MNQSELNRINILIINQPLRNRGDDSAHRAFLSLLSERFSNCNFKVLSFLEKQPEDLDIINVNKDNVKYENIKGIKKLTARARIFSIWLGTLFFIKLHPTTRKYYNEIIMSDIIINAPGGICLGGFMNWWHLCSLFIAKKLKKPIVYWGRSIGPFTDEDINHRLFKARAQEIIKYFDFISLRDKKSYNIGKLINPKTLLTLDSCYLTKPITKIPNNIKNLIGDDYMLFVPNELTWHYKYKDCNQEIIKSFYIDIIQIIRNKFPNIKIVLLPQTYHSYIDDYKYFLSLKDECNDNKIIVIDELQSSDIQQSIVREAKFLIGARYHSIVFAINNGTPFISLSYEHKMSGMLEILDLNECKINIEEIFLNNNKHKINGSLNIIDMLIDKILDKDYRNKIIEKSNEASKITNDVFNQMCEKIQEIINRKSNSIVTEKL